MGIFTVPETNELEGPRFRGGMSLVRTLLAAIHRHQAALVRCKTEILTGPEDRASHRGHAPGRLC